MLYRFYSYPLDLTLLYTIPCTRLDTVLPTIVCTTILLYTILYYTILYYTILYYTILYYICTYIYICTDIFFTTDFNILDTTMLNPGLSIRIRYCILSCILYTRL